MFGYTKQELSLIWLDSFAQLEYKHKKMLLDLSGKDFDATKIIENGKEYLVNNVGVQVYSVMKASLSVEYITQVVEGLERRGVKAVTYTSSNYPKALNNVDYPPLVLYAKGNIKLLNEENIFGIVGSRKSLAQSLSIASDYAKELSNAGFTLVTGIAQGVDESVIKSVLNGNGKVISILAGGIDNVYPQTNQKLCDKVAVNGLVISERLPEVTAMPYMFPVRNRLISGLSKGVLIVSAGKKSGTLWTADYALEYGKDVFAIPYGIGIASGEGCNKLIKQGALLTDTPEDIITHYGIKVDSKEKLQLTPLEKNIVEILSQGSSHVELIAQGLNKKTFEITPTLSIMEIKGLVIKTGNNYQLTRSNLED